MFNSIRKFYQKFVVENFDINMSYISFFCDVNYFGLFVLEILMERYVFVSNMIIFNILLILCIIKKIVKQLICRKLQSCICVIQKILFVCMGVVKNVLILGYNWKEWKGQKQCFGLNGRI